jgi:hypothetical protein
VTINFSVTIKLNLLTASIASLMLAAFALTAQAQQKAPEKATPAAPAAKAEKKAAKPKSACNALADETACKANSACAWVAALMDKATNKQKRKAYCRTKPKPPAKKKTTEPAKK